MELVGSSGRSSHTFEKTDIKKCLADLPIESVYDYFSQKATNMHEVVESFEVMKEKLGMSRKQGLEVYQRLRRSLGAQSKARDVLNMLEMRASQKEYMKQKAASDVRVLIIGAGPVGLRLAIECILLGAEVVIVEKRWAFTRHNILHLWPFTIQDLKQLGAKKFYEKFCMGAIDHISIRSLQCILLKVALMLGVRFYSGIEFIEIQQPDEQIGWHAKLKPSDHPLNRFEFDVLVGADGARKSSVPGFDRKELRGKLALVITANFRNKFTREEAAVQEISGVALLFNQKFFKDLKEDTDIDLENIVYYKDNTHYFVMTAKKDSLLQKRVLKFDHPDTSKLLHPNNIRVESLYDYAMEAASWSTDLSKLDFMLNHHNKNDVDLFDFTSIHQAKHAARALNRGGKVLYLCLTGDALLEPFWPTGTGCSRGFLSAMDTAWLVKRVGQKKAVLEVLCERETIFQRLPQATPETLCSDIKAYTIDPKTRYLNLHLHQTRLDDVSHLYESADITIHPPSSIMIERASASDGHIHVKPTVNRCSTIKVPKVSAKEETRGLLMEKKVREGESTVHRNSVTRKRSLNEKHEEIHSLKDSMAPQNWLVRRVAGKGIKVNNLTSSWSGAQRHHPYITRESCDSWISSSLKSTARSQNPRRVKKVMMSPSTTMLVPTGSGTSHTTIQEKPQHEGHPRTLKISHSTKSIGTTPGFKPPSTDSSDYCYFCSKRLYLMERMSANGFFFHRSCFRCTHCNCQLKFGGYSLSKCIGDEKGKFFCTAHYQQLFMSISEAINSSRAGTEKGKDASKPKESASSVKPEVNEKPKSAAELITPTSSPTKSVSAKHGKKPTLISCIDVEVQASNNETPSPSNKNKRSKSQISHVFSLFKSKSSWEKKSKSHSNLSSSDMEESHGLKEVEKKEESEVGHSILHQNNPPISAVMALCKEDMDEVQERSHSDETQKSGQKCLNRLAPTPFKWRAYSTCATQALQTQAPSTKLEHRTNPGLVERLALRFEQLEFHARESGIQQGSEGRERAKSLLYRQRSAPVIQPHELACATSSSSPHLQSKTPSTRKSSLQGSRRSVEDAQRLNIGSRNIRCPQRKWHSQISVSRPLIGTYDTSDVAIQERRKQQQRFRDAQLIQREMNQLERQYEELEDVGREIEGAPRDATDTKQEASLMKSWLSLVDKRTGLVSKTSELRQRMKKLELEDRQYEIDRKLCGLSYLLEGYELTVDQLAEFEDLCKQKIKIVDERDELVNQTEEERLRELEEDNMTQDMITNQLMKDSENCDEGSDSSMPNGANYYDPSRSDPPIPSHRAVTSDTKREKYAKEIMLKALKKIGAMFYVRKERVILFM